MPPQEPNQDWQPDPAGKANLDAMSADVVGGLQAKGEADNVQVEPPPTVTQDGKTGQWTFKGVGPRQFASIQEAIALGHQTKDFVNSGMAQHLTRLAALGQQTQDVLERAAQANLQKADVLQQHPIIAQLGRTLSYAAQNYAQRGSRATPLLNAIGAYGADFFKDSPEALIQRAAGLRAQQMAAESQVLNQTEDQRRFQIQQDRIDAQIAQQKAANELAQKKETRLTKSGFETQIISLAKGRTAPDPATIVNGALAHDFSPAEAADLAKRAQEVEADSRHEQQLIQAAADKKEATRLAQQTAMFNATTTRMFSLEATRERFQRQQQDDRQAAAELKAGKIGPVVEGTIRDYGAAIEQMDRLEKLIKENPDFQGPVRGRIPSVVLGKAQAQKELSFRSAVANGLQSIVKAHGAGARGYTPQEMAGIFSKLSPAPVKTQAENLANVDEARQIVLQKAQALADTLEASGKDISKYPLFKRIGVVGGKVKVFNPATGKVE